MTKEEFTIGMQALMEAGLKGEKPDFTSPLTLAPKIWYSVLQSYDFAMFQTAILQVIKTSTFFPAVSELIEKMEVIQNGIQETGEEAYKYILEARRGEHKTPIDGWIYPTNPDFADCHPEVKEAIDACGGWNTFRMVLEKDEHILRAQFRDAYNSILRRKKTEKEIAALSSTTLRLK